VSIGRLSARHLIPQACRRAVTSLTSQRKRKPPIWELRGGTWLDARASASVLTVSRQVVLQLAKCREEVHLLAQHIREASVARFVGSRRITSSIAIRTRQLLRTHAQGALGNILVLEQDPCIDEWIVSALQKEQTLTLFLSFPGAYVKCAAHRAMEVRRSRQVH
jgi:hypothetical protein